MPDEIVFQSELGVIEVRSYGIVTADDFKSSLRQVGEMIEATGVRKVLIDASEQEEAPTIDAIEWVIGEMPRACRYAVIPSGISPPRQRADYLLNTALFQGLPLRLFASREECLEWLHR